LHSWVCFGDAWMDVTYAFELYNADYCDFHKQNKVRSALLMLKIRPLFQAVLQSKWSLIDCIG
jgi:hypothetical protein